MNIEEKLRIAKRNVVEIVTEEELKILLENSSTFNFYFGTAPTGPFHIGYLIPAMKTIDLINIGGKATILIADYHAYLDDRKTPWEEMQIRTKYYEICLKKVLEKYEDKIKFVYGSSYQTEKEYIEDLFKLAGLVSVKRAVRAASEVVRMREDPLISSLLYPIMQNLDVKYLNADIALGGIDQRHVYMLGREIIENVGYKKFISIFTPLITSLKGPGVKMSASIPETHIKIHEDENSLLKKINNAYCPAREINGNPIIEISKYLLFPYFGKIKIERDKKYGGDIELNSYEELEKLYVEGQLHPLDLKQAVFKYLNEMIKPVREYFEKHKDFFEEVKKSMQKSGYTF